MSCPGFFILAAESMDVSIIICTRNRLHSLKRTIRSISETRIPRQYDVELIVIDNGSTDGTVDYLRSQPVTNIGFVYRREPRKGVARARNLGIAVSQGDLLLWADDDIIVPSNWIGPMCEPLRQNKADAVQGAIRLSGDYVNEWMKPFHRKALAATESFKVGKTSHLISANMAVRKAACEHVGGFDENLGPGSELGHLEDALFAKQLLHSGFEILFLNQGTVIHNFDKSRLSRHSFISEAVRRGQSLAYIHYHWMHKDETFWRGTSSKYNLLRNPMAILIKRYLTCKLLSIKHYLSNEEGPIGKSEFWSIMNLYSIKFYINNKNKDRIYTHINSQ